MVEGSVTDGMTEEISVELGTGVDTSVELAVVEDSVPGRGVGIDVEEIELGDTVSEEVMDVGGRLLVTIVELVELPSVGGNEVDDSDGIGVVTDTVLITSVPDVEIVSEGVGSCVGPVSEGVGSGVGSEDVTLMELVSEGMGTDELTSPAVEDSEGVGTVVTLPDSEGIGAEEVTESLGGTSEGVGTELGCSVEDSEGVG